MDLRPVTDPLRGFLYVTGGWACLGLAAIGETLNLMTLGGLALAVGILVDDATVTIENINWHLEQGKDVETAIMDGARQIVTPAFVSLLCICIVFVPMFFLEGVARYLFVPMALAVIFAMISSFILSRTLVNTMAKYLLKAHHHAAHGVPLEQMPSRNPLVWLQRGFERRFERFRLSYQTVLAWALAATLRSLVEGSSFHLAIVAIERRRPRSRRRPRRFLPQIPIPCKSRL